uniref:Uncharacterized protein n=1 Tax=Arundo donax TaxID=35708 RepID=A0A0A9ANM1_ARUDO
MHLFKQRNSLRKGKLSIISIRNNLGLLCRTRNELPKAGIDSVVMDLCNSSTV